MCVKWMSTLDVAVQAVEPLSGVKWTNGNCLWAVGSQVSIGAIDKEQDISERYEEVIKT